MPARPPHITRLTLLAPLAALALASAAEATITYDRTGFTALPATQWTVVPNCTDTVAGNFSNYQQPENNFGTFEGGSLAQSFKATTSGKLSDIEILATGTLTADGSQTLNIQLLDAGPAGSNGAGLANVGFATYGNATGVDSNSPGAGAPVISVSNNLLSSASQGLLGPGYPADPAGSTLISWDFKFADVDAVDIVAGHEYIFEINSPAVNFIWFRMIGPGDDPNGQAWRSRQPLNGNPARDFSLAVAVTASGPAVATWDGSTGNWSDGTHWSSNPVVPINSGGSTFNATVNAGHVRLDVPVAVTALTLGGATGAWTGNVDLAANVLVVQPAAADKDAALANLKDQISFGTSTAGANGISSASTLADPTHKITVVVDNALLNLTSFGGMAVDAGSLLVESTYFGDANFDRKVDVTDLGTLATNYGKSVTAGVVVGDFNQDGKIDVTDLGLLATDYGLGTTGGPFAAAAVPEPASLAILALASTVLWARRKR